MNNSDSLSLAAAHLIERLGRVLRSGDLEAGLQPVQWEAMRYLARANRFSRTPAALASYLGTTRGTVSQTVIALEAKGLVTKTRDARDGRSITLDLTAQGRNVLKTSALGLLATDIRAATDAEQLANDLDAVLRHALARRGHQPFGVCKSCVHFRPNLGPGERRHFCALLKEPLSDRDGELICVEQTG